MADKTYFKDARGNIFRMNRDEAARSGYTETTMEAERIERDPVEFSPNRRRRTAREDAIAQEREESGAKASEPAANKARAMGENK